MRTNDCFQITILAAILRCFSHSILRMYSEPRHIPLYSRHIFCLFFLSLGGSLVLFQPMWGSLVWFQHTPRGNCNCNDPCNCCSYYEILAFGWYDNDRDKYSSKECKVDCCHDLFESYCCFVVRRITIRSKGIFMCDIVNEHLQ